MYSHCCCLILLETYSSLIRNIPCDEYLYVSSHIPLEYITQHTKLVKGLNINLNTITFTNCRFSGQDLRGHDHRQRTQFLRQTQIVEEADAFWLAGGSRADAYDSDVTLAQFEIVPVVSCAPNVEPNTWGCYTFFLIKFLYEITLYFTRWSSKHNIIVGKIR